MASPIKPVLFFALLLTALLIQCRSESVEPRSDTSLTLQNADPVFESLIADEYYLDRKEPVLRWRFNLDHLVKTYRVRAYRQEFSAVSAGESDRQIYRLPHYFVDHLPAGTELIWQVTAVFESGAHFESEAFVNLLE